MNTPLPEQGRPPTRRRQRAPRVVWRGRFLAHAFPKRKPGVALCGVYADERDVFMSPQHRSVCDPCVQRLAHP